MANLVKLTKKKDSDAFAELYRGLYKKVYFFALLLTKSEVMAEDAAQDTFILALRRIDTLKNEKAFVSWLNKITYNVCMNLLRERQAQGNLEEKLTPEIAHEEYKSAEIDPFVKIATTERKKELLGLLENLSPNVRATIILFYYHNMKIKEIAEILNIPPGTVKSRLDWAKKNLKKNLLEMKGEI